MNVLDGISKQLGGRSLQAKLVLEGVVWFSDLHKMLSAFTDDIAKFSAGPSGTDEVQKYLQKVHDSSKALWTHLGGDQNALALLADVQAKRSPEDLGVEGPPSYMTSADGQQATMQSLNMKILECGIRVDAWKASGIPEHIADVLATAATVKATLEKMAGADKLGLGELDDRMFEVHYSATGQIGNRHFQDQGGKPGLMSGTAALLKQMKRELMVVKAAK
ncbi:MAG: hypothetical protein HYY18_16445 [Planctomycetes bacterium]|nr:hypothetical protein [Planctomycetota bacterium]